GSAGRGELPHLASGWIELTEAVARVIGVPQLALFIDREAPRAGERVGEGKFLQRARRGIDPPQLVGTEQGDPERSVGGALQAVRLGVRRRDRKELGLPGAGVEVSIQIGLLSGKPDLPLMDQRRVWVPRLGG